MRPTDAPPPGADDLLDGIDLAILDNLRALYAEADPMPGDLVERVRFALALEDVDVEVFRLCTEQEMATAGARGHEESRTVTFDSDSLTIMISITPTGHDQVRLDGWLAPPGSHAVELRTAVGQLTTTADVQGRFALDSVPHGLAQLVVHPDRADDSAPPRSVVTPAIVI
jgi:hypothetical protein